MKELQNFITNWQDATVEVSPGVNYSMKSVNEESARLYNGVFLGGSVEDNGFDNVFMRKIWVVYRTLLQGSDLDLKNLTVRNLNGVKFKLANILRMAITSHLKRTYFGELLDQILADMCWYGSAITKRVDGRVETVDIRNYITEGNIQDPQSRSHAELVMMNYEQMQSHKEEWANSWEAIEANWAVIKDAGESQFKVVEFWTWGEVEGKKGTHKICVKCLDNTLTDKGYNQDNWEPYIELDRFITPYKQKRTSKRMIEKLGEDEEMFPYNQFDLFKVPGRTQGMGCGELLASPQQMYNELYNNKRKLDLKGLLGISVHTATQGVNGLTTLSQESIANLDTGAIITLAPGETFQQLPVDMKSGDFDMMEGKLFELMRQIIGITSQGTGEEMPASTSATQASINQQTANTVFDYTRERMHHGIKRLFNEGYAEDIINELDEKEVVSIIGSPIQLQELDKTLIENAMNKWAIDTKNATGLYPSEEEYAMASEQVRQELSAQGENRFPQIKKAILKDMEWMLDFDMTAEAYDTKLRSDALIALKNDPNTTKSKARMEDELLTMQGINPLSLDKSAEEKAQEEQLRQQDLMAQSGQLQAPAPVQ
jgi:hypothetical protein